MSTDEESGLRRIAFEYFAHHPHLWVLTMQCVRQIANKATWHILNRVLANPINARNPHPPERILYFVPRHLRLFLVHIRQIVAEPAVERVPQLILIRVRREQNTIFEPVQRMLLLRSVKPIVQGWIF